MSKIERVFAEMARTFNRPLTDGELAAMTHAAFVTNGGVQKLRRAIRKAAYTPIEI